MGGARLEEEEEVGLGQGGGGVMCHRQHGTQEASGWLGLTPGHVKYREHCLLVGG